MLPLVAMHNKTLLWVSLVLVILGGIGFRFLQLRPYPLGESNWVDAPNERHRAYVYSLTDKGFFGGTWQLYRITVEFKPANGKRMAVFEQDIGRHDVTTMIDLKRLETVVTWAPDSSRVQFHLTTNAVIVDLPF